jgi:hypothetical protein
MAARGKGRAFALIGCRTKSSKCAAFKYRAVRHKPTVRADLARRSAY